MPQRVRGMNFSTDASVLCLAFMFFLLSLLSSSLCGRFLLPLCFIAFGVMTALNANAACGEFYECREMFYRRVVISALLTPPCFLLGVGGMSSSGAIRLALNAGVGLGKKELTAMYTVMAAAAAASLLLLAYAVLK